MLKSALKWGAIIGALMCVVSTLGYAVFPLSEPTSFALAEYTGFTGVIAGMILLLFAYSEQERAGQDRLKGLSAIILGVAVTLVAGIVFGAYNVVYSSVLVPDFLENYHTHKLAHTGLVSGPEFDAAKVQIQAEKELLQNTLYAFFAMASAVWVVGVVYALVLPFIRRLFVRRAQSA